MHGIPCAAFQYLHPFLGVDVVGFAYFITHCQFFQACFFFYFAQGAVGYIFPIIQLALGQAALELAYGDVAAVRDVSFEVRPGEILGLIGPNGAGKSTVFNLINGVFPPSDGVVRLPSAFAITRGSPPSCG